MSKTVLVVHAHPEPKSLTRTLAAAAKKCSEELGHQTIETDLYGARWKAVLDADDFPVRANKDRLSFVAESANAFSTGTQTADVEREQQKLLQADAVVFAFPLWWFGLPAILKGWVDRVFANGFGYGYKGLGNCHRYGEGALAGKRVLMAVSVGGPVADYGPRGINGPLEQLLFPISHGTFFFAGMDVLPTFAVYGTGRLDPASVQTAVLALRKRIVHLFTAEPIPFRRQNGGDYPDGHTLAEHVAPGVSGILAHVTSEEGSLAGPDPALQQLEALPDHIPVTAPEDSITFAARGDGLVGGVPHPDGVSEF